MSLALRLAVLIIAVGCASLFLFHPLWFPAPASHEAAALDREFLVVLWVLGALFVLAQLALFVVLGQTRAVKRSSWSGNWKLELAWAVIITAIFFAFNVNADRLWSHVTSFRSSRNRIEVEVTGVQFQWYFRYPGPDGKLGRIDPIKYARPDEGNPLGIDPADPAGHDDIVSSSLVLPAGRDVDLILRAQDVIHSVFIPVLRFKQDAVPGMEIHASIAPEKTGEYELVCTQLCGLGHYRMRAAVRVVSEEEFKEWLRARAGARAGE